MTQQYPDSVIRTCTQFYQKSSGSSNRLGSFLKVHLYEMYSIYEWRKILRKYKLVIEGTVNHENQDLTRNLWKHNVSHRDLSQIQTFGQDDRECPLTEIRPLNQKDSKEETFCSGISIMDYPRILLISVIMNISWPVVTQNVLRLRVLQFNNIVSDTYINIIGQNSVGNLNKYITLK